MTISSQIRKVGPFAGNDTTTVFPFYFKIFKAADLYVVRSNNTTGLETPLVLDTDYIVTLNSDQNANPGGNVTLPATLASGTSLVITSLLPYLQQTDLTNTGGFYPAVITNALDRLTIFVQQLAERVGRALSFPISDSGASSTTLPGENQRAGTVLAFNDVGAPVAGPSAASLESMVAVSQVYLGASDVDPVVRRDGSPLQSGDLYFNTSTNSLRAYSAVGNIWVEGASGAIHVYDFVGDGVTVTFELPIAPGNVNVTQVYIGGAYQFKNTYTVVGTTITFDEAPPDGVEIEVVTFSVLPIGQTSADLVSYPGGKTVADLADPGGTSMIGTKQSGAGAITMTADEKLNQIVDARDYGAVTDGVTNNNTAVGNMRDQVAATNSVGLVPVDALHTLSMPGTERIVTTQSLAWETERLAYYANQMRKGVSVGIECYGDSTMYGAQVGNTANQSPLHSPGQLQATLRKYYQNTAASVLNQGRSSMNIAQMLAGTDGSGKTFEEWMASSTASIIYCNHCINSSSDGSSATSIQYRKDLEKFVDIVRKHGKVPILCTPNPVMPFQIGWADWTETTKGNINAMRQVALEKSVTLVDNCSWAQKAMATGRYAASDIVGDGVHPTDGWYRFFGQNFAIPIIKPSGSIATANPYAYATDGGVTISGANPDAATLTGTITGYGMVTGDTDAKLSMAIVVDDGPQDLYLGSMMWASGAENITLSLDQTVISSTFSNKTVDYGSNLILDYETKIASGAVPGLHLIEMSASTGSIGVSYCRLRHLLDRNVAAINAIYGDKETLLSAFSFVPASASGASILLQDIPSSHLIESASFEMNATLGLNTGLVISGGKLGSTSAFIRPSNNIILGLDGLGHLTLWESGGARQYTLGAADLSLAQHQYGVTIHAGAFSTIDVFLDNVFVASHVFGVGYAGGSLGFWSATTGGVNVESLYRVA